MPARALLRVLPALLLALTACGGPEAPRSDAPATPAERWGQAQKAIDDLTRGAFRLVVHASFQEEPMRVDEGKFDRERVTAAVTSTISVQDQTPVVSRVRVVGTEFFMQMEDWGRLDGCWMGFPPDELAAPDGVEPAFLMALESATLRAEASDDDRLALEVPGRLAFRLLGVGGRALAEAPTAADEARVPATLTLEDGVAVALELDGKQVAEALPQGKRTAQLRQFLPGVRSATTWDTLDAPLDVPRPGKGQLTGRDGGQGTPCADPED